MNFWAKGVDMAQRKYAEILWIVSDVMKNAKEMDLDIDRKSAELILKSKENRIMDAMVAAGWDVIENAITDGDCQ